MLFPHALTRLGPWIVWSLNSVCHKTVKGCPLLLSRMRNSMDSFLAHQVAYKWWYCYHVEMYSWQSRVDSQRVALWGHVHKLTNGCTNSGLSCFFLFVCLFFCFFFVCLICFLLLLLLLLLFFDSFRKQWCCNGRGRVTGHTPKLVQNTNTFLILEYFRVSGQGGESVFHFYSIHILIQQDRQITWLRWNLSSIPLPSRPNSGPTEPVH